MVRPLAALIMGALAASGCAHAGRVSPAFASERSPRCARETMDRLSPYRMPLAGAVMNSDEAAYLADFPAGARRAARAAGLEPLLVTLLREHDAAGPRPSPRLMALELELSVRMTAFVTQVAAVAFEVKCTADEVRDVLVDLEEREHRGQFRLAIGSLLAGAVTASAAAALTIAREDDTRTPAIISLGGGVVTAALGVLSLERENPRVELAHDPNLLRPVFDGHDEDHLFPSFVFRMLMDPDDGPLGSPRARLLEAWKADLDEVHMERAAAERLLYGTGGVYTARLVEARTKQLERLQETLRSIARDLELLNRYLVRSLYGPAVDFPAPPPP
jgi:hypothetical protein